MTNQEKYAQQMQNAGVCDARGAALCATVKELPDGRELRHGAARREGQ